MQMLLRNYVNVTNLKFKKNHVNVENLKESYCCFILLEELFITEVIDLSSRFMHCHLQNIVMDQCDIVDLDVFSKEILTTSIL